ncbi:MAG: type II toxin-antitoxin system RelB/DinJ family antitoxin, partial [Oscillospiraceae bacterium]|nr:type II toxin-antitoxin system RelB/DinJ family antitoxin [Oscillospiraceae bacterium]
MAQVMVNFRIDEDVKKDMEQACREMGLSMTTAFTIFAKKVGKEKRIPFEVTAQPQASGAYRRQRPSAAPAQEEEAPPLAPRQE